jgi:hypothetical protein
MTRISTLLCSLLFAACNSTGPTSELTMKPGTYEGTFSITYFTGTDSASTVQSHATFTFGDTGWYTCWGNLAFNPPAGGGEYRVVGDSLVLEDLAMHTAEFDWTLILNGSFYMTQSGGVLTLTQDDRRHSRYRNIVIGLVTP